MCKSLIFTEFSNIANQIAVKKSFRKQWPNGLYGVARTLNSASHPVKKGRALYSSVDSPSREKGFLCSLCCFLISADIGGPVARGKAPFLCSFLGIEISKFRNDLLLFFFVVSWIWFLGKIRLRRKRWVYKTISSIQLNCNCQHSSERKILLSKVNGKTLFWILFLP